MVKVVCVWVNVCDRQGCTKNSRMRENLYIHPLVWVRVHNLNGTVRFTTNLSRYITCRTYEPYLLKAGHPCLTLVLVWKMSGVVLKILTETGLQLNVVHETDNRHTRSVGSAGPVNDSVKRIVVNSTGANLLSCKKKLWRGSIMRVQLSCNYRAV